MADHNAAVDTPPTRGFDELSLRLRLGFGHARYAPYQVRDLMLMATKINRIKPAQKTRHQQNHKEHKRERVDIPNKRASSQNHLLPRYPDASEPYSVRQIPTSGGNPDHHEIRPPMATRTNRSRSGRVSAEIVAARHIRRAGHHAPVGIEIGKL